MTGVLNNIKPASSSNMKLSCEWKRVMKMANDGFMKGNYPILSPEGTGGTYFLRDEFGKILGVFKPIDEEPMAENNPRGHCGGLNGGEGMKKGSRIGEGAIREIAAYVLDHPIGGVRNGLMVSNETGFSGVPPTMMVKCRNGMRENIEWKIGSLQLFVENNGSCEDIGCGEFAIEEVHKIALLDLRLANADRHGGNILIRREDDEISLIPIDHGYCLPESFEDCTFDWLYWRQACQPFDSQTLLYIESLDVEKDIDILKLYGLNLSSQCFRIFRISTMLLKKGANRGLSPYQIGNILCRGTFNKESKIEEIVHEALDTVLPGTSETAFLASVSKIMDRYLDEVTNL